MEPGSIGNLRTEVTVSAYAHATNFYRVKSPGFLFHRRHGHGHGRAGV